MNDSVKLLRECSNGLDMAISSLEHVKPKAEADNFTNMLDKYYNNHMKIKEDIDNLLNQYDVGTDGANSFAEAMSNMKISFKLTTNHSDNEIADLMIDGCNMGIKSVSRYMNQYSNAEQNIMQLANDIVVLEQNFSNELRQYL